MFKNRKTKYAATVLTVLMSLSLILTGCGSTASSETAQEVTQTETVLVETSLESSGTEISETFSVEENQSGTEQSGSATTVSSNGILDTSDMFTDRDMAQTVDLTEAVTYTVADGEDIHITEEGIYLIQGTASEAVIYVEAEDTDKVQLVLDGVSISNTNMPCIYVVSADKVWVTTVSDSSLTVTEAFAVDDENADAAIFSCEDLVLNGTGTLTITSSDVGVDTKDDLKITGGTYNITAATKAFEANDSIRVADGTFNLVVGTDGLHAENSDDDSLGYVYIAGGTFDIEAGDDGIHGNSVVQIDGGTITIEAAEAIEGTYVQINGGTINISATDDGINAANKSSAYTVTLEITGGDITIVMGSGDTDALDANGNLIISGGTLDITANSAFDYDGTATYTGGTLIVNGEEVTELTQSMMGGFGGGNMGGQMPGNMDGNGQIPGSGNFGGNQPGGGRR